ncbi:MAG: PEP-CTERM sorting domain-containing protein [Phycisphaeraceae bacterium]
MKRLLPALAATTSLGLAGTSGAVTLVSSALDNTETDITGSNGIFAGTLAGDSSAAVGGVTTTVLSNPGPLGGKLAGGTLGPKTTTLRAVSAASGMDLTYDVVFEPFIFRDGADVEVSSRVGGYAAVSSANNNLEREQTTANADGVEFFRVTIGNVVNSGTTSFDLDGAVTLRFNGLSGISISDTYVNGVTGTVLGSGGTGTSVSGDADIALSGPAASFAIVGTADDLVGPRANFENRWEGLAVQFTAGGTAIPGDTDNDGDIDDSDLGTAFSNYTGPLAPGTGGKTAAQGDTDGDGDVDDSDLGTAFSGYTGPLGPAAVPEPTGLALVVGLGTLMIARRRRP